jgi:hypothetical protein
VRTRKRTNPGGGVHLLTEDGHLIVVCRDDAEADRCNQVLRWATADVKDKTLRLAKETDIAMQTLVESL